MPATTGVENDVPTSFIIVPRPVITAVGLPSAITSGLMRPSAVLPMLLNEALRPSGVTAPTVMMSVASAGTFIFFHAAMPSLPALFTSIMPLSASIEAVREIMAVRPSSCW
ncbi:unknown [Prevotella sp. CAG:1058]|nr:unknown [Prevotella sp. CAG:1058]